MNEATTLTVRVPLRIRRKAGQKTVVMPGQTEGDDTFRTLADPALVKAMARAFRYQKLLDEVKYASITEMAAAEKIERGYLGSLLRLTLLAPRLVEAILDGRDAGVALPGLLQPFPADWTRQQHHLQSSVLRLGPLCAQISRNPPNQCCQKQSMANDG